jgi:hypothetical protein
MDTDGNNQEFDFNMEASPYNANTSVGSSGGGGGGGGGSAVPPPPLGADIDLISSQFRTMNTNDKEHLMTEFRRLSNTELSNEGCCFYLDMAAWNLNAALWAYYEYETAAASANGGMNANITGNVSNSLTTT